MDYVLMMVLMVLSSVLTLSYAKPCTVNKISPSFPSNCDHEDLVINLPGQPKVDFRHYAGYVTVNEEKGRALFYWFFEASTQPQDKPLVLWLNGGPGCSSVGYGATQEIGPFLVSTNGSGLTFNPYAWNREANILFLESPVGVGFSYTNTSKDFDNIGDHFTANDAYELLNKWFLKFPAYRNHAFYIAGESYAGKYIPELAEVIHDKNNDNSSKIDLKGILMGNPETCDSEDWRGMVDYAWSHAVVSDETHGLIRESCNFSSNTTWSNPECTKGVNEVLRQYKEIDIYSLYTSVCIANSTNASGSSMEFMFKSTSNMMPRIMGGYDPCLDDYARAYYNRPDVQIALHVSDGLQLRNWSICNSTLFSHWADSKPSVLPIYKKLIAAGLRIWVYSGDTDGRVPVLSTRYSLNALGLPITKPWTPWYQDRQVSGWYQEYKGLTFATFRGAGHAVPIFKPSSSLTLFSYFLQSRSLPSER
ncbi:hypothetical protein KSS87_021054 [Heliosperma pusillum]|nr:hypothetical protein KSS87_021054 [Heliosperma pusillum]